VANIIGDRECTTIKQTGLPDPHEMFCCLNEKMETDSEMMVDSFF
jgi:hypothetical protein